MIAKNITNLPTQANPFGGKNGQEGTDALFVIISSFIIFTMQSGFGLLESGMVSRKSEANVIVKNMVDVVLGGIAYWFVGFGFSFGPNNNKKSLKMSGEGYFIIDVELKDYAEAAAYTKYFFQLTFATTATTIVSGAVAERIKFRSYMIFVVIMAGLIYPFPAHWIWASGGWLHNKANDFAGSSVVHMAGGSAAFAGCVLLGPRNGRFENKDAFAMASPTNVILGTFFLWWGWIGFNCGSAFSITGNNWMMVSRIAVVTMNGAMAGGAAIIIFDIIMYRWRNYTLNIGEFSAGVLGGLVSITGGCNQIRPWEALVIGFIGGLVSIGFIRLLEKFKLDDPVGCIGIHWAAGFWGMLATGLFGMNAGVFRGHGGKMLGYNFLACLAITLWSGGLSVLVFGALRLAKPIGLRLSTRDEKTGSDMVEHNVGDVLGGRAGTSFLGKRVSLHKDTSTPNRDAADAPGAATNDAHINMTTVDF